MATVLHADTLAERAAIQAVEREAELAAGALRVAEPRSLTWGSFNLEADPPTVTVKAAYSKHRRNDTLPLKPSTAQTLTCWRSGAAPDYRPFGSLPDKTASMLRADLADAGSSYRDDAGRVADFHSLRPTFMTGLARGGVHPKPAQQFARHSTITLTMDRHTHTVIGETAAALDALPDLTARPAVALATGTGGAGPADGAAQAQGAAEFSRPAALPAGTAAATAATLRTSANRLKPKELCATRPTV